jgi:hypothetical protein
LFDLNRARRSCVPGIFAEDSHVKSDNFKMNYVTPKRTFFITQNFDDEKLSQENRLEGVGMEYVIR